MKLTSQEYQRKQRNNLTVSPEERQVMRLFNGKRKIEEFFQKTNDRLEEILRKSANIEI